MYSNVADPDPHSFGMPNADPDPGGVKSAEMEPNV
jgi:hypothetical protein